MNIVPALTILAESATEKGSGLSLLGIDPRAVVLQTGTFVILYLIVRKFSLEKIIKSLEDRRSKIEEGIKNAHRMEKLREQTKNEHEKILAESRKHADEIIAKASEEAGSIIARAQLDAEKRSKKLHEQSVAEIEQQIEHARKTLKNEMLELVAMATGVVLNEKITGKKDNELIAKALKEKL